MAVFVPQFWLLGAFFQLQHPVLPKHFNRNSLWFSCDRTPSLNQDPFRCVFSRLNIDFWGSQFWPPNLSWLKVVLNFWSSLTGVHPPGILALCQKKLFKSLKANTMLSLPPAAFPVAYGLSHRLCVLRLEVGIQVRCRESTQRWVFFLAHHGGRKLSACCLSLCQRVFLPATAHWQIQRNAQAQEQ